MAITATPRKRAYLKPVRYRVRWMRAYESATLAQEASTPDQAMRQLVAKYGKTFLPHAQHRKACMLAYRTTKLILGDRIKPDDRPFYVQSATSFNGFRLQIECM